MRRFELSEGTSNKFWQIEIDGSDLHIQWGRIGTAGQAQTKSFASEGAAQKEHDKLVAEKVKKGYAEASAAGVTIAKPAPKPAAAPNPIATPAASPPSIAAANASPTTNAETASPTTNAETASATAATRTIGSSGPTKRRSGSPKKKVGATRP